MSDLFWPPALEEPQPDSTAEWPAAPQSAPTTSKPWKHVAAAGASALVFGGIGVGVGATLADNGDSNANSPLGTASAPVSSSALSAVPKSYAAIAAKVLPSVVSINVQTGSGGDTGSGVVLRADGYILTNNHVVADAVGGGGTVAVTFNDGTTAPARIVGADQEDDLAVVKVNRTGLDAAALGSASLMHVGDPVLALGSPLGLQGTVTSGIISAVNRPVQTGEAQQTDPFGGGSSGPPTVIDAIQTDAAINPGNSGGPLVNTAGQVIGINSAIASTGSSLGGQAGNIGVGFAIPIDQAKVVAQQLIATGKASHPLLGVSLANATDAGGNALARVQALTPNGPAARAGIQVGDIIVAVAGQKVAGAEAVIAAVRAHQPGQQVSVVVLHSGERKTFTVRLADASDAQG